MRFLFTFFIFIYIAPQLHAQNVGIGTTTPNSSAMLDIQSHDRGLLPPRMTYAQRNAITNPVAGLIIWCNDCSLKGQLQVYNGTEWQSMIAGNAAIPPAMPIVLTTSLVSVDMATLSCSGNIISDGGAPIIARGIVWGLSPNPTVALPTKTIDSNGIGSFTATATGLLPNTTYHFRAYAENSIGTAYGVDSTFTTVGLTVPIVNTKTITSITTISASSGGAIISDGGSPVTSRGVIWSTLVNPTVALSTKTTNGSGTGNFTSTPTNLIPNTLYHIRAYATNAIGTGYGADSVFTTNSLSPPVVNTNTVTSFTGTTGVTSGTIVSDGGASVTSRGMVWSTSVNPTTALTTKTINGSGLGTFTSNMTGLTPSTTYHYRAFATNSVGTSYGPDSTFTTSAPLLPSISTAAISSVTSFTAASGGSVASDGGGAITERGVVWGTSPNPTIALSTKTSDGAGLGSFTSDITSLTPNTTYYVRAFATNVSGTAYGAQQTFSTPQFFPSTTICTKTWMSKNLSVVTYRNGDTIPQVSSLTAWRTATSGAWCWYNNDSATYAAKYGRLYNWFAVNDSRGLAPAGWHIPTNSEWNMLIKCVDPAADTTLTGSQSFMAGSALKNRTLWSSDTTSTNSSGFSAGGGGYRTTLGTFDETGIGGYWWSSNLAAGSTTTAISRVMYSISSQISNSTYSRISGFSVRCVKD